MIDCRDQCPGFDDLVDSDSGGLADLCDPCPSGLCELTLPDEFYFELPGIHVSRISRDGRWIAGFDSTTFQGVLIPTEQLLANPGDTSYYEYLPDERVIRFYGFTDDNNIVLASITTAVPESSSRACWLPRSTTAPINPGRCSVCTTACDQRRFVPLLHQWGRHHLGRKGGLRSDADAGKPL